MPRLPSNAKPLLRDASPAGAIARHEVAIAIMAAGKGTRLKSKYPKVIHKIAGKALLEHVIAAAAAVLPVPDIYAIIGFDAERVRAAVQSTGVNFVSQTEQRGTGHAILTARPALRAYQHVIVLSGDVPLIRPETIRSLLDFHLQNHCAMTLLTAELPGATGYGRVIRKPPGSDHVAAIVEQKALTPAQSKVREINSGIYAFAVPALFNHIGQITTNNVHGEFYLTDMAGILVRAGEPVMAVRAGNPEEVLGSNTIAELVQLDAALRSAKTAALMAGGVTIYQPASCVIDNDVTIGADTIIEPFVQILGKTTIGEDCRIQSYTIINDSSIAGGVTIKAGCIIEHSVVEEGAILGPYAHLRPESHIGAGAHVGNFVETKKTRLGKGSKANHLSYLGDSLIGEGVNIGAGTITCNYDGVNKHVTTIESGAFIGSDSTLVAPVTVGRGAYVGAGSCITEEVPPDALAIGRQRQVVIKDWASMRRATLKKNKR